MTRQARSAGAALVADGSPPRARPAAHAVPLRALRREVVEAGRRMWARGLVSGCEGNLSVRVRDDAVLCTPSGVSKGFLDPRTLRIVGLDGAPLDAEDGAAVTSEIRVHLAVYRARPDVRAVVHSHAPRAAAFAIAGAPLPEGLYPEADVELGRVPLVPYALPGTAALADAVAASLTPSTRAMLLAHHGTLTLSARGLLDAYLRLEVLESWCEIVLAAARLGAVHVLSPRERAEVLALKRARGVRDDRDHESAAAFDARNRDALAALGLRAR